LERFDGQAKPGRPKPLCGRPASFLQTWAGIESRNNVSGDSRSGRRWRRAGCGRSRGCWRSARFPAALDSQLEGTDRPCDRDQNPASHCSNEQRHRRRHPGRRHPARDLPGSHGRLRGHDHPLLHRTQIRDDTLRIHPALPDQLDEVALCSNYREQPIRIELSKTRLRLTLRYGGANPIKVLIEEHLQHSHPDKHEAFQSESSTERR
jgi:Glycosyl hydrolase family 65, C-terminal domain